MRDTPEKITCGQIQGGQVERLGLYSVAIQCLGRGMTRLHLCYRTISLLWSKGGQTGGEETQ